MIMSHFKIIKVFHCARINILGKPCCISARNTFKYQNNCRNAFGWPVTPKSVPPKIGPAGLILAEKPAKTGPPGPLLLPKLVRLDRFCLPKMVPSCQNQSPMGERFWQKIICQLGPKSVPLKVHGTLIPARTWLHGCSYYI